MKWIPPPVFVNAIDIIKRNIDEIFVVYFAVNSIMKA